MAQLSEVYPRWESIMANCKGQIFFQPNDQKMADIISTRLGSAKNLWGDDEPLASPKELMGPDFAEKAIVIFSTQKPIKANLPLLAYKDEKLRDLMCDELAQWEEEERSLWYPEDMKGVEPEGGQETGETVDDTSEPKDRNSDRPRPPDFDE